MDLLIIIIITVVSFGISGFLSSKIFRRNNLQKMFTFIFGLFLLVILNKMTFSWYYSYLIKQEIDKTRTGTVLKAYYPKFYNKLLEDTKREIFDKAGSIGVSQEVIQEVLNNLIAREWLILRNSVKYMSANTAKELLRVYSDVLDAVVQKKADSCYLVIKWDYKKIIEVLNDKKKRRLATALDQLGADILLDRARGIKETTSGGNQIALKTLEKKLEKITIDVAKKFPPDVAKKV